LISLDQQGAIMSQTASRVVAVLFVFASALAVESLHAADAAHELTGPYFLDIIGGVDGSTFDVGPDTERISLSLDGEHLVFKKDSYQHIADGISVWSGRDVQKKAATYLYVAKNGDDSSIKLVKGDFEYDVIKDSSGYYELRATDLTNTVAEEFLTDSDHKADSGASQTIGTDSFTTFAVAPPFEINVNLAYTKAALAHFPSATALKNDFVIGLAQTNDALRNSNLNVRVKLNRIVFVKEYTENATLSLVREDVEAGLVPGLPVPIGKNKTVLVVDVYGKWNGTAMLSGPYAVIKYNFISTSLTLTHEIGHLFGAIHLKTYQFINGRYTVMTQDRTLREPIYSNPKVQWLGEPAGTSTLFNAKRMCNEFFELGTGCWITPQ
jgi:hypothetical protein